MTRNSSSPEPSTPVAAGFRIVRCPSCQGDSVYASSNPSRPFCSERCKNADFGAWANEQYRLNAKPPQEGDESGNPVDTDH